MHKLPESFLQSLEGLPGYDRAAFLHAHQEGREGAAIRLNLHKTPTAHAVQPGENRAWGEVVAARVPWCPQAFHLTPRPAFVFDPLFHAGAYYVQEASSMLLDFAWRSVCGDETDLRVLDLCAAPGGKSTLLASQENIGLLLSNEIIRNRVPSLYENVVKWGLPHMLVSSQDPRDFQSTPGFFDAMVVDAPCSGSGLFRKDPDAVGHWSPDTVTLCSQRQQRILADALPALRQGGYLFYATCSFSREEDEDICDWLVVEQGMTPVRLPVDDSWGVVESVSPKGGAYGYRCYPHRLEGEGFFLAVFRRDSGDDGTDLEATGGMQRQALAPEAMRAWVKDPGEWSWTEQAGVWLLVPAAQREACRYLNENFRLRRSGLRVGTMAHGQFNPDHELSMSTILANDLPSAELDLLQSLRYLKRELPDLPSGEKGWMILRHQGMALGLAKKLPNRINNYYPQEWRIRANLPEGIA